MRMLLIRKRRQDTILKPRESARSKRKYSAKSGFNQPCGVKPVKPGKPGVHVRQMARQGAQIAVRVKDFGQPRDLAGLDRRAAHRRFGGEKR